MTRKKDKQRDQFRRKLDPGYKGFRGHQPPPPSQPELKSLACTVCGRKKNVPVGTDEEGFVCLRCRQSE